MTAPVPAPGEPVGDLDDLEALRAADPSGMLDRVTQLPADARAGYAAGRAVEGLPMIDDVSSIVVCGMGGSAVAGDLVRSVFRDRLTVPFEVVRGPQLPAYVGHHSLVVCSSYSGNTAETLSCFSEAQERGARVLAITSGGRLGAAAGNLGVATTALPPGYQPRAALGQLAFGLLGMLEEAGWLPSTLEADVEETARVLEGLAARLGPTATGETNLAKDLARRIGRRTPVIWGAEDIGSVAAMRWKTQMNENGKTPAFSSALPELDHNEVVGWTAGTGDGFFLIGLRVADEHPEVAPRFPLSIDIAEGAGLVTEEIVATGATALSQLCSLILTGDFASVYLGILRGFDPTPVEVIDRLKASLTGA
ncbi:MAG: bifunctional phosphoglucose/phosphomannose isomerase [Actinomycetota bacterium]